MTAIRKNMLYIIAGVNGTGKTKLVMEKFIMRDKRRSLIVNPMREKKWNVFPSVGDKDLRTFKGIAQIKPQIDFSDRIGKSYIPMLQSIYYNYQGGNLVMDDCREIIQANLQDQVKTVMLGYRQNNLDVFAIFHSLRQVPPGVWDHCNGYLILFKTQDRDDVYSRLPASVADEIWEKSKRITARTNEVEQEAKRTGKTQTEYPYDIVKL